MNLETLVQKLVVDPTEYNAGLQAASSTLSRFGALTVQAQAQIQGMTKQLSPLGQALQAVAGHVQAANTALNNQLQQQQQAQQALSRSLGGPGGVQQGLHPYYIMHQLHTAWVEGGNVITASVRSGLAEVSQLVGHGVQVGMAGIGSQVALVLHSTLGVGNALGGGIGGIGAALGGGIARYGQAYAQGQGGMLGAAFSGIGTAATAGAIFGPAAAVTTGLVGAANVFYESVKAKVEMSMAALATGFNMTLSLGEAVGGTLSELTTKFVVLGAEMERSRKVVTAFAQDQGQMFGTLQKLSREMPLYSFQELNQQFQVLAAEGIPLDQMATMLKKLGDIAHGDEAVFHRAALAVGEIYAQGFVSSQRIRQLASIGIGTADLAKAMGVSPDEFVSKLHSGQVGPNILARTLNQLTGPGGRMFGLGDQQLDTVFGQFNRLRTVVDQTFGRIGESLNTRLGLKDMLSNVSRWFEDNFDRIQGIVTAVFDRIRTVAETVGQYVKSVWASVADVFGLSGKSIEQMLPTLNQVKIATRDTLNYILELFGSGLGALRGSLQMIPEKGTGIPGQLAVMRYLALSPGSFPFLPNLNLAEQQARSKIINDPSLSYDEAMKKLQTLKEKVENGRQMLQSGEIAGGEAGQFNKLRHGFIKLIDDVVGHVDKVRLKVLQGGVTAGYGGFPGTAAFGIMGATTIDRSGTQAYLGGSGFSGAIGGLPGYMRRYQVGGGVSDLPEGYREISAGARKLFQQLERQDEEKGGRTPAEEFLQRMRQLQELQRGRQVGTFPGFGGPAVPIFAGATPEAQRIIDKAKVEEIEKYGKSLPQLSHLFPKAVGEFTSEAQDTINRTNFDQRSVQQEVRDILTRALKEQEEQTIRQGLIKDALQDLVNNGFNFKGDPAGVN